MPEVNVKKHKPREDGSTGSIWCTNQYKLLFYAKLMLKWFS